ncbi:hypothetical protein [Paenibacillus swuensis]|uniref:hypothetical protein n=1 Tax=Paenibacillus swuensis TaxID=1178515 RepID=UPI001E37AFF7|nr:hypothetical protein [Paenibacillus swuensis]
MLDNQSWVSSVVNHSLFVVLFLRETTVGIPSDTFQILSMELFPIRNSLPSSET